MEVMPSIAAEWSDIILILLKSLHTNSALMILFLKKFLIKNNTWHSFHQIMLHQQFLSLGICVVIYLVKVVWKEDDYCVIGAENQTQKSMRRFSEKF
jgi:hypothetical protein